MFLLNKCKIEEYCILESGIMYSSRSFRITCCLHIQGQGIKQATNKQETNVAHTACFLLNPENGAASQSPL
jgi:hypothetical protein